MVLQHNAFNYALRYIFPTLVHMYRGLSLWSDMALLSVALKQLAMIELTVPWEDCTEKAKYQELVGSARVSTVPTYRDRVSLDT